MNDMKLQIIDGHPIHSDNKIRVGSRIHGTGTATLTHSISPSRSMCNGCNDDFYNKQGGMDGNGCWAFKSASVVNKVGYSSIHVANGPDTKIVKTLSCWHGVCK